MLSHDSPQACYPPTSVTWRGAEGSLKSLALLSTPHSYFLIHHFSFYILNKNILSLLSFLFIFCCIFSITTYPPYTLFHLHPPFPSCNLSVLSSLNLHLHFFSTRVVYLNSDTWITLLILSNNCGYAALETEFLELYPEMWHRLLVVNLNINSSLSLVI